MVSPWVWVLNTVFRRWDISLLKPATTMVWVISTVLPSVITSERVTIGQIVLKVSYLFDITRTKNVKRKVTPMINN